MKFIYTIKLGISLFIILVLSLSMITVPRIPVYAQSSIRTGEGFTGVLESKHAGQQSSNVTPNSTGSERSSSADFTLAIGQISSRTTPKATPSQGSTTSHLTSAMSTILSAFPVQIPLREKILLEDLKLLEASDLGYKYHTILPDGSLLNVGVSTGQPIFKYKKDLTVIADRPDQSCLFYPQQDKCKADPSGNCPRGFFLNDDDHCVPNKRCPKGFEQHDEDETGTCYPVRISSGVATKMYLKVA